MKDQLNVMSKFLNMGMTLDDVDCSARRGIPRGSSTASRVGHLSVGAVADIAVLRVEKGKFAFVDSFGARMDGTQKLYCDLTVASGKVVWDLNGRTRDHWDRLGKYQALGEPYWDASRGAARPMDVGAQK